MAFSGCSSSQMRPTQEIVKTLPHVAFEVDDLKAALDGKET